MISRKKLLNAQINDKIVYYDYIAYKRASGWTSGIYEDDWYRPLKVKRAKYFSKFLYNIPNYYFLGVSIKDIIKSPNSKNLSSLSTIAISLCFHDFDICIASISNQNESNYKIYKHTYLLLKIENRRYVIDTEYGMITSEKIYKDIFGIKNEIHISSKEIKKTKSYKFLINKSNVKAPSYDEDIEETSLYFKYISMIDKFLNICKLENTDNKYLNNYFKNIIYKSCSYENISNIRRNIYLGFGNLKVLYPKKNMISTNDDIHDDTLQGRTLDSKNNNKKVLESINKQDLNNYKYSRVLYDWFLGFIKK